ncbi:MAG: GPW/gp25 family protein [Chloroflexota bacterium]
MPLYGAWYFVEPERFTTAERTENIRWGLKQTAQSGVALVAGDDSIRQAVLLLLMTKRGERVMRPSYGCDLHRLMFAPNNDATANIAEYYIRTALAQWEPRVDLVALAATPSPTRPNILEIRLDYQVRTTGHTERLDLSLDLLT